MKLPLGLAIRQTPLDSHIPGDTRCLSKRPAPDAAVVVDRDTVVSTTSVTELVVALIPGKAWLDEEGADTA
ncbi:hypothetical protein CJ178_01780 [Rhodococcus sp. ACPA4]|nr:hypothetical protein CJ178_01780 [Rhodococcus sp. ACPA4]